MHLKPSFLGKHVNLQDSFSMEFLFQDPFCISCISLCPFHISQCCFNFLWIQGAPDAAGFPVVCRNVFAICYKSFIYLPFAGKTNNHVGFPSICMRLIKESLAWPLLWYQSDKVGLPGGSHICQVHTPLLDGLSVPLLPNICVGL